MDNKLLIQIKADTAKATKSINSLSKEINKLKKTADGKWGKDQAAGFAKVTKSAGILNKQLLGLAATFISLQGVRALVTTAADLEEGFLGVAKTTGLTGEALDELKNGILDLSTSMAGISTEELQSIAETAGQLGISGKENILEFTEVIAKIGATTELSAEQAATSMAKLGISMKVDVSDFEKLGSVVNELSNTTTATAGNLFNMGQRISGVGKTFGLTADEVLAFAATLTDVGMSAELGGTALSKVMLEMIKDTEKFAKAAGVPIEEFARMLEDEPVKALQTFIDALGEMDKSAKVDSLKELGLSSSGVVQTMLKLSGATDTLSKNLKTAGDEWKRNTSLQKEYDVFSKGFNAQMDKLGNTIKKLASKIGDELLPKLKEMADGFSEWVNSLSEAKVKEFSEDIAKVVEVLGDAATAVGKFVSAIGGFITDYPKLSKGLFGFIVALKTLQFLLPAVGASMVGMGGKAAALGAATATLKGGVGVLGGAFRSIITIAGPWGVAMAAMAAMAATATIALDSYIEGQKKANEATNQASTALTQSAAGTNALSDAYLKLNEQVAANGMVTQEQYNILEQNIIKEIAATEARIQKMEQVKTKTNEQTAAIMDQAGKLGFLKAQLDTLPTRYTIDLEIEARKAEKELEESLKRTEQKKIEKQLVIDKKAAYDDLKDFEKDTKDTKIESELEIETDTAKNEVDNVKDDIAEPIETDVDFIPDTKKTDTARTKIAKPIIVPVTYVPTNSPPKGGGYAAGGFTGSGSDTDVAGVVHKNEFVVPANAVRSIGVNNLYEMISNMKMPGYSNGGLVGSTSSSPDTTPINLSIGGNTFGMMGDTEVAMALQRYINTQGGL